MLCHFQSTRRLENEDRQLRTQITENTPTLLIVNLRPCMCHTRTLGGCICLLSLRCAGNRRENEGRTVHKLNTPLNNLGHVLFLNLLCRLFYDFCYLCLLYHQCLGDLIDYIWILVSLALSCEGIGISMSPNSFLYEL